MLANELVSGDVVTEDEERRLGWKGKTNDVSAIVGDTVLLIECKLSALYVESKRTATPEAVIADVRKQIADGEERRGLFQLYDKIAAIKAGRLPKDLQERYKRVSRFFPVLLLFDDIAHANAPEVLGNIIRDELRAQNVDNFEYQIWQLEELEWLTRSAGKDTMTWVAEKFSAKNRIMDLRAYLADKTEQQFLKDTLYLPAGDSSGFDRLRSLSDKYNSIVS